MKKPLITLSVALAAVLSVGAADDFSGYEVAPEGAWCWFADPRAIHYEDADAGINASYLGYIDVHGNIRATQYDFSGPAPVRSEVLVRSYFQPDDHNNPTFLTLPDKRVLIIYSRHTDEKAFYYRISTRPGDISDLGPEKKIVTTANTTYPSPFILSDDPGHFYLCWRGIGWHPTIARFTMPDENDNVQMDWGAYQMVQSTGARPYAKYYSNGKDKIYLTYTTGHPDNEQPNWVYFNQVNIHATNNADGSVTINPTLEDITGKKLRTIDEGTFSVNKTDSYKTNYPNTVVDATSGIRDWVWQTATDTDGNPVIAMVKIDGGKTKHDYYYAKWTGNAWRVTFLANGGGRFHSSNTEYCYSGGMALDPQNVKTIYLSIPTEGDHGDVFEIWKYTVMDDGSVDTKEQVTVNSLKNNVRPYVLPNSQGSPLTLGWLNGDYYYWMVNKNYPAGYPTSVRSNMPYTPVINKEISKPLKVEDYNMKDVVPTETVDANIPAGQFTLNVSLQFDPDHYHGTILSGSNFKYAVSNTDLYPYAEIAGTTYKSSNKFYTSDSWAQNSSGTNGDNWPTKLGAFEITLSYDGSTLTIYRNGLIDQKIAADGLDLSSVKIGGFTGKLGTVTTFDHGLTQDEIKYAMSADALEAIVLPEQLVTDIVLPTISGTHSIVWTSSNPAIISTSGIYHAPEAETAVTLTANLNGNERTFNLKAMPRNLDLNLLACYDFEPANLQGDQLADLSGKGNDLTIKGSAVIDGTLNLKSNTAGGFATNGHAILPEGLLDGIRSYTVCFSANAESLESAPRFYDFGAGSSNSLFCRANTLAAGVKLNGGTTNMVDAGKLLKTGQIYNIAVTYSAATGTTTIYVDGRVAASGRNITAEPYMLVAVDPDTRNYIGRTQWWDGSYAKDNIDFTGTIDNFRFYNTALTDAEIAAVQGLDAEDPALDQDVTTALMINPDFEGSYAKAEGTGVANDRAIYLPEGWTLIYSNGDSYDLTALGSDCLQFSLFSSVPVPENGGDQTFYIRQRWGTSSTLGLSQTIPFAPAGYYRLTADAFCKGNGVPMLFANNSFGRESGEIPTDAAWCKPVVSFSVDGLEDLSVGFDVRHPNEVEVLSAFDNVKLTDVTANRSQAELDALLARMSPAAATILTGEVAEPARQNLIDAKDAVDSRTSDIDRANTLELFNNLRDAILAARKSTSGLQAPEAAPSADKPVFDLTGRRVADSLGSASLAPGIYIQAGRKIYVR